MRWKLGVLASPIMLALAFGAGCSVATGQNDASQTDEAAQPAPQETASRERARSRVQEHMAGGNEAQARVDAGEAAKEGVFGLIQTGIHYEWPAGVVCFTPGGQAPEILKSYGHGDVITPEVQAAGRYAAAYNHLLVEAPDYPYRDLCRPRSEKDERRWDEVSLVTRPAREVRGRPRDLFEAARRGSAGDVARLLKLGWVNAVDGLNMTPLAWAVARNNWPAIDVLLSANANPWAGGDDTGDDLSAVGAVYWAAALGRGSDFRRLVSAPGRPFEAWSGKFITAALSGGDRSILSHMLNEPHQGVRLEWLERPLPSANLFELVLKHQPDLATPLLFRAVDSLNSRPDLVRLAIAAGANPNAVYSYESPLTESSKGIGKDSVEIVDILLKAGADPNFDPHRTRGPAWVAVGMLKLDDEQGEVDVRANAIFHRLVAAGADLNRLDWQNRPPIWFLLFPYSYSHEELDASFVTPELLDMLVDKGMNVNAVWNGKRVLNLVEAQAGRDSELAATLRRLGARR